MPAPGTSVHFEEFQLAVSRVALPFDLSEPGVAKNREHSAALALHLGIVHGGDVGARPAKIGWMLTPPARGECREGLTVHKEPGVRELLTPVTRDDFLVKEFVR